MDGVIAAAVAGILLLLVIVLYNRLVRARVRVEEAWAQVAADLQRRHQVGDQVVATVGGYANHERAALEAVTAARSLALSRRDPIARAAAEDELGSAVTRLLARLEAYPELQASDAFGSLQKELVDTEERLAFARDFANHRVATYHERLATFPSVLVARAFGFKRASSFVAEVVARPAPTVNLAR
jgi:LemA protein